MSYGTPFDRLATGRAINPTMSGASIVAIVCALSSFFVGAGWGFLLAVIAIVAGVLGLVLSLSPRVRGGVTSFLAIIAGAIGIVTAIVKLIVGVVS
jgi:hypothetical protein